MGNIFFTSDLHFGHNNVIIYDERPFYSMENMEDMLIGNWNNVVGVNDTVYILGDFSLSKANTTMNILKRLNGKKILIEGNHDADYLKNNNFDRTLFEEIVSYKEINYKGNNIVLCHYPISDWNGQKYGSLHFHGHIHKLEKDWVGALNVGCCKHNYTPLSIDEAIRIARGL